MLSEGVPGYSYSSESAELYWFFNLYTKSLLSLSSYNASFFFLVAGLFELEPLGVHLTLEYKTFLEFLANYLLTVDDSSIYMRPIVCGDKASTY